MSTKLLSAREIAILLNVSRTHAFTLIQQMPHVKLGKSIRVTEEDFQTWLLEQRREPSEAAE